MSPYAVVGLALGTALLLFVGWTFRAVLLPAALTVGVTPLVGACACRVLPLGLHALGWRALLPAAGRPRFGRLLRLRWIGESINTVLPVAQVGGDVARAHLLALDRTPRALAAAAMFADLGLGVFSQLVFATLGVLTLAGLSTDGRSGGAIFGVGLTLAVGAAAVWWAGVRFGGRRIAPFIVRRQLAASLGWHVAGWAAHVLETAVVLRLAGWPVPWSAALIIESVPALARAAAFFVPGGVGVQEGTLVFVCTLVGVPPEAALGLALVKRLRELALGLPGLVAWVFAERGRPLRLGGRLPIGAPVPAPAEALAATTGEPFAR